MRLSAVIERLKADIQGKVVCKRSNTEQTTTIFVIPDKGEPVDFSFSDEILLSRDFEKTVRERFNVK